MDAVGAFGDREKRLAIRALHARHQHDFAVPFHGANIECGIHGLAFEQKRIGFRIEIVAPLKRRVRRRQHRMAVTLEPTARLRHRLVGAMDEMFVIANQRIHPGPKLFRHHLDLWIAL